MCLKKISIYIPIKCTQICEQSCNKKTFKKLQTLFISGELGRRGFLNCIQYPTEFLNFTTKYYFYNNDGDEDAMGMLVRRVWLCNSMDCSHKLCPWDFLGKSTGAGLPFPPLGIFPTQRSNPRLQCLLSWQGRFFTSEPSGKPNSTKTFWGTSYYHSHFTNKTTECQKSNREE